MDRPKLILASGSIRRRDLMIEAGYQFDVVVPSPTAECGVCSRESPPELVARLALQKAQDVAMRQPAGIILGSDTVAECHGRILGKPRDRDHAKEMLQLMRGRPHHVYTGVCLWCRPSDQAKVRVDCTRLVMDRITDSQLDEYLDSGAWRGKAGAFGYQDRLGWVHIEEGSESNVVGLPLELLDKMLQELGQSSNAG